MSTLTGIRASWIPKIEFTTVPDCPVPGECWLWRGATDNNGYGRVQVDGALRYLHRVIWERLVWPIPAGLQIDHLCRQRACCAPHHLEPVTCLINVRRGQGPCSKTACPRGHAYEGDNLYVHTDHRGYSRRICRQCNRERCTEFRRNRRESLTQQTELELAS